MNDPNFKKYKRKLREKQRKRKAKITKQIIRNNSCTNCHFNNYPYIDSGYCKCHYGRFKGKRIKDIPNQICEHWREPYVVVDGKREKYNWRISNDGK